MNKIKEQIGKPVETKIVVDSSRQYHDSLKRKANKFLNSEEADEQTYVNLFTQRSKEANIYSSNGDILSQ